MVLTLIYNFFQMSRKSNFPPILLICSAERIRGIDGNFLNPQDFSFFFIKVLKVLLWYFKWQIMNVWEAMQQELINFYQFLYHVTPAVNFQVKSWPDSVFCRFCRLKFVSTRFKGNPAFCLLILRSSLNFLPIPRIRGGEESAELPEFSKSWRFLIFLYWSFKITALKRQITNN